MGKEDAVKRKRFSVEQIVAVLKQAEMGTPVADLIRHLGIAEQTFYRWKQRYAGLESEQVREFKQLQDENTKLKRLVADLSFRQSHAAGRTQNILRPSRKRIVVGYLRRTYPISERRACRILRCARATYYYRSHRDPRTALRQRLREMAQTRARYGYRKIRVLLNREGWAVGKNLVYRLYREEGLMLRRRSPRGENRWYSECTGRR
jgi:putative transposase